MQSQKIDMPEEWTLREHGVKNPEVLEGIIRLFAPSDDVCIRLQREAMKRLDYGENSTMGFRELAQEFLPPMIFDLMRFPPPEKPDMQSDEALFRDSVKSIQRQIVFAWTDALSLALQESLARGEDRLFLGCNIYPIYVRLAGGYWEFFDLAESDLLTIPLDQTAIGQLVDIFSENVKNYLFAETTPEFNISPDLRLRALADRNFEIFKV